MLSSGIYLILCSALGYLGGIWLWREVASNPNCQAIRKMAKWSGLTIASALAALFSYLGWFFLHANAGEQMKALQHVVPFLWFCLGYLAGYDIILIILFVPWELADHPKPQCSLHLNKPLTLLNLVLILASIYPALVFHSHPFWILTGFCLSTLIWWHLCQFFSFSIRFKRLLAIFSFATTGYLYFTIISILWVQHYKSISQSISLGFIYLLLEGFLACLVFYFVALSQTSFKKGAYHGVLP
jgi:hypothetical protein